MPLKNIPWVNCHEGSPNRFPGRLRSRDFHLHRKYHTHYGPYQSKIKKHAFFFSRAKESTRANPVRHRSARTGRQVTH